LRRWASPFTSFITGNRPYTPVPMMSWRHFQGIFILYRKRRVAESVDKLLGRSFLPFADLAAINDDVMLACRTVDPNGAEGKMVEAHMHLPACCGHALFFEVMAEKVDQRCSTSLLPQCGHKTSPSS
jgi:hypothetical protein